MTHAVGFFEIPVRDSDRATRFYQQVLGYDFTRTSIDHTFLAQVQGCRSPQR